jgi:hypothetical protein
MHLKPLRLSGYGHREVIDEADKFRHLEVGQPFSAMILIYPRDIFFIGGILINLFFKKRFF